MPKQGSGKRTVRKGAGLSSRQRQELEDDIFEDENIEDGRSGRLEDEGFEDGLPANFDDEDICSDDEDDVDDVLPERLRSQKNAKKKKR